MPDNFTLGAYVIGKGGRRGQIVALDAEGVSIRALSGYYDTLHHSRAYAATIWRVA